MLQSQTGICEILNYRIFHDWPRQCHWYQYEIMLIPWMYISVLVFYYQHHVIGIVEMQSGLCRMTYLCCAIYVMFDGQNDVGRLIVDTQILQVITTKWIQYVMTDEDAVRWKLYHTFSWANTVSKWFVLYGTVRDWTSNWHLRCMLRVMVIVVDSVVWILPIDQH